jgi:hypothetical protein
LVQGAMPDVARDPFGYSSEDLFNNRIYPSPTNSLTAPNLPDPLGPYPWPDLQTAGRRELGAHELMLGPDDGTYIGFPESWSNESLGPHGMGGSPGLAPIRPGPAGVATGLGPSTARGTPYAGAPGLGPDLLRRDTYQPRYEDVVQPPRPAALPPEGSVAPPPPPVELSLADELGLTPDVVQAGARHPSFTASPPRVEIIGDPTKGTGYYRVLKDGQPFGESVKGMAAAEGVRSGIMDAYRGAASPDEFTDFGPPE